jgi:hypothetical protein
MFVFHYIRAICENKVTEISIIFIKMFAGFYPFVVSKLSFQLKLVPYAILIVLTETPEAERSLLRLFISIKMDLGEILCCDVD